MYLKGLNQMNKVAVCGVVSALLLGCGGGGGSSSIKPAYGGGTSTSPSSTPGSTWDSNFVYLGQKYDATTTGGINQWLQREQTETFRSLSLN